MLRIDFKDIALASPGSDSPQPTEPEHMASVESVIAHDLADNPQIWPILDLEELP